MDATHGTEYLIDYYALLGVERDADKPTLRAAYLEKQRLYHPDRFEGLADELKTRAAEKSRLLAEAYATLNHRKKRAAYDRRLAEWDGPISTDGTPIIDLSRPRFHPEALLQGDRGAQAAKEFTELALRMSGHDPATLALLKRLYEASETPEQDLVEAYSRAVSCKETYLAIVESVAWEEAGFRNRPIEHRVSVRRGTDIEDEIAEARTQALTGVDEVLTMVAGGEVFLIGPGRSVVEPDDALATVAKLREAATERFEAAADLIRKAAADRAANASEGLGLLQTVYDPPAQEPKPKLLVLATSEEGEDAFAFLLEGTRINGDTTALTPAEALDAGYNVIRLAVRDGLDVEEQVMKVVFDHFGPQVVAQS